MEKQAVLVAVDTANHNPRSHHLGAYDRSGHTLVFGTSLTHKPALLWNMMVQDISAGVGLCILDVTGDFATDLLSAVPNQRVHSTSYFQPLNDTVAIGFNPFRGVPAKARPRVAQDIMELFEVIWDLSYERTPLLLRLLRASTRVLLDWPESSFLSLYPFLTNSDYRRRALHYCEDPVISAFWEDFERWPARDKRDKIQPVMTRLEAFLSDPQLRNVLGQIKAELDVERIVRNGDVFIAGLSARKLGAETSRLFASLLAMRFRSALMGREGGWPFYIYLPEAHRVHARIAGKLLADTFAPGGAVVSVDQIGGYETNLRSGLLAADKLLAFRLAPDDVRYVMPRFPIAQAEDNLSTLAADHLVMSDHGYELKAIDPLPAPYLSGPKIIERSQDAFGVPRRPLERKIAQFFKGL